MVLLLGWWQIAFLPSIPTHLCLDNFLRQMVSCPCSSAALQRRAVLLNCCSLCWLWNTTAQFHNLYGCDGLSQMWGRGKTPKPIEVADFLCKELGEICRAHFHQNKNSKGCESSALWTWIKKKQNKTMYFCKLQQLSNIRTYWGRSEWFAFGLGQLVCIANKDIARLLFRCSWAKLFGCNKAGCKWRWWVRWSSSQGVSLKTASWLRQQKCTWALVIAQHRGSLYVCSFAHGECQGAGLDGSGHLAHSLLPQLWG